MEDRTDGEKVVLSKELRQISEKIEAAVKSTGLDTWVGIKSVNVSLRDNEGEAYSAYFTVRVDTRKIPYQQLSLDDRIYFINVHPACRR
jgi:hypothetical protein